MNTVPRKDVGAAGLSAVLAAVIMMILKHDNVYDFQAVYGLVLGLGVAGAGYLAGRNKSFVMLIAAPVATLAAAALGKIFYGVEWDNAAVSVALAAFVSALMGYAVEAKHPDAAGVVVTTEPSSVAGSAVRARRP